MSIKLGPAIKSVVCAFLLHLFSTSAWSQQADVKKQYQQMIEAFRASFLIPILYPGGQRVGAVFNTRTLQFIDDGSSCFPGLVAPSPTPSALPSLKGALTGDLSLALGVNAAGVKLSGGLARLTEIEFTDVIVQAVPETALRKAYSSKNCPQLQQIIKSQTQPPDRIQQPLLIVGTLYTARRRLIMRAAEKGEADATISFLKQALSWLPLSAPSIGARVSADKELVVSASSQDRMPVALRAAFIPELVSVSVLGPGAEEGKEEWAWVPFEPDVKPSQQRQFNTVVDDILKRLQTQP